MVDEEITGAGAWPVTVMYVVLVEVDFGVTVSVVTYEDFSTCFGRSWNAGLTMTVFVTVTTTWDATRPNTVREETSADVEKSMAQSRLVKVVCLRLNESEALSRCLHSDAGSLVRLSQGRHASLYTKKILRDHCCLTRAFCRLIFTFLA